MAQLQPALDAIAENRLALLRDSLRRHGWDAPLERIKNRGGRPKGRIYQDKSQFLQRYVQEFDELSEIKGKRPAQVDVSAAMGISRSTFIRHLKDWEISYPPVKNDL